MIENLNNKVYVVLLKDLSGSMGKLKDAAIIDYNKNIEAIKKSASQEMIDTVVSVIEFNDAVYRSVVISNPHVLHPLTEWGASGQTKLYDALKTGIDLMKGLPDYHRPGVSFLIMTTTDGQDNDSKIWIGDLEKEITELTQSKRWTFVFRVPPESVQSIKSLGVPSGNIQVWDGSGVGLVSTTKLTEESVSNFYKAKSSGVRSSNTFYANTGNVTSDQVEAMQDISMEVVHMIVWPEEDGKEIKPFVESKINAKFLKGSAFYQLSKVESRVQENKMVMIRVKSTGRIYYGDQARSLIGLPSTGTVRLHPGEHPNYDIYIQSTSINRKLVAGTSLLYWAKIGTEFTAADTPWIKPEPVSPITQTKKTYNLEIKPLDIVATKGFKYFPCRREARLYAKQNGKQVKDQGANVAPKGQRWYVFTN